LILDLWPLVFDLRPLFIVGEESKTKSKTKGQRPKAKDQELFAIHDDFAMRHDHRWSTNPHLLHVPWSTGYLQPDPARTMNKVALFDNELILALDRFQLQRSVVNEITTQRSTRASCRRIFRNIVSRREEPRMGPRLANLKSLT
jgi:hypothetical protein